MPTKFQLILIFIKYPPLRINAIAKFGYIFAHIINFDKHKPASHVTSSKLRVVMFNAHFKLAIGYVNLTHFKPKRT